MAAAGGGILASAGPLGAVQSAARRGMPPLTIKDIKVIMTRPAGSELVVVKIQTSEPGLHGVGCYRASRKTDGSGPLSCERKIETIGRKPESCIIIRNLEREGDRYET